MGTSLMVGAIGRVWHGFTAKCYNYMIDLASRETALYWLFAISFIESSFFPIPPDIMLIPMVLATPKRHGKLPGWQRWEVFSAGISDILSAFISLI